MHTHSRFFFAITAHVSRRFLFSRHSEQKAIELLTECGWQLDAAADRFFMSGGGGSRSAIDQSKVEALFNSYKGALLRRAFKTSPAAASPAALSTAQAVAGEEPCWPAS